MRPHQWMTYSTPTGITVQKRGQRKEDRNDIDNENVSLLKEPSFIATDWYFRGQRLRHVNKHNYLRVTRYNCIPLHNVCVDATRTVNATTVLSPHTSLSLMFYFSVFYSFYSEFSIRNGSNWSWDKSLFCTATRGRIFTEPWQTHLFFVTSLSVIKLTIRCRKHPALLSDTPLVYLARSVHRCTLGSFVRADLNVILLPARRVSHPRTSALRSSSD